MIPETMAPAPEVSPNSWKFVGNAYTTNIFHACLRRTVENVGFTIATTKIVLRTIIRVLRTIEQ